MDDPQVTVAVLREQMKQVTDTLSEIKQTMRRQDEAMNALANTLKSELSLIQHELTARKEYGRGIKAGLALTWMLIGGAVVSALSKIMATFGGTQ